MDEKWKRSIIWLLAGLGLDPAASAVAQAPSTNDSLATDPVVAEGAPVPGNTLVSVSMGVGAGSLGFGGKVDLTVSMPRGDIILRSTGASDFQLFGPSRSVEDLALLYGVRGRGPRGWVRAAAGPGWVHRVEPGDPIECAWFICTYEEHESTGPGLALQLDAVWAPWRSFGLGVSAGANLNGERTFGTFTLSASLGRVR